jgi:quercetin dioxygenase-like cupin family protein
VLVGDATGEVRTAVNEVEKLIVVAAQEPTEPVKEGVQKRVIGETPSMSVTQYFWEKDHRTVGDHAHAWDTVNYIVEGKFEVELRGERVVLGPGDGYFVPAGTPRSMRALEEGSYILVMERNKVGQDEPPHTH